MALTSVTSLFIFQNFTLPTPHFSNQYLTFHVLYNSASAMEKYHPSFGVTICVIRESKCSKSVLCPPCLLHILCPLHLLCICVFCVTCIYCVYCVFCALEPLLVSLRMHLTSLGITSSHQDHHSEFCEQVYLYPNCLQLCGIKFHALHSTS